MSILAGDLACAWSQRALYETDLPAGRLAAAAREMALVHEEVVEGQILDVASSATSPSDVEKVHALKTASYSVRGPLVMGGCLAGATPEQKAGLAAFGTPLGVAFQLRDDVLGVFGDAGAMGKGAGDLAAGKRSALVVEALRDARAAKLLERVLGRQASEEDMRAATGIIEDCGARARVEDRIRALCDRALSSLEGAWATPRARTVLGQSVRVLVERDA